MILSMEHEFVCGRVGERMSESACGCTCVEYSGLSISGDTVCGNLDTELLNDSFHPKPSSACGQLSKYNPNININTNITTLSNYVESW